MRREEFYFFYSGPFSQWAEYPMTVNDVNFSCCEQYMMAMKARVFGDDETCEAIMAEPDPAKQKALGKTVRNFDQAKWDAVKEDIVYKGNYAKFTSYPHLALKLAATKGKIIVEASPTDQIWGIGLKESDPRATNPDKWRGQNLLGKAIMRVRDKMEEEGWFKKLG